MIAVVSGPLQKALRSNSLRLNTFHGVPNPVPMAVPGNRVEQRVPMGVGWGV